MSGQHMTVMNKNIQDTNAMRILQVYTIDGEIKVQERLNWERVIPM
jgi:hypothetical protein